MISSSDFTCSSSVVGCLSTLSTPRRSAPVVDPPRQRSIGKADLVSASGQFPWPPAGSFVAVYGQDLMAADKQVNLSSRCCLGRSFGLVQPPGRQKGGPQAAETARGRVPM